jgi:hypothetical protein
MLDVYTRTPARDSGGTDVAWAEPADVAFGAIGGQPLQREWGRSAGTRKTLC